MTTTQRTTKKGSKRLIDVTDKKWKQELQLSLQKRPFSLRVVAKQLFCCTSAGVIVYNTKLQPVGAIANDGMGVIHDVVELPAKTLVVAASKGLFEITKEGEHVKTIAEGSFTSVQFYKSFVYGATKNGQIRVYDSIKNFLLSDSFKPACHGTSHWITIAINQNSIMSACAADTKLRIYSLDGGPFHTFGEEGSEIGMINKPRVCDVDKESTVFVADQNNDRFQVLTELGEWFPVTLKQKVHRPYSAVYFSEKLFVLSWDPYLLTVFSRG